MSDYWVNAGSPGPHYPPVHQVPYPMQSVPVPAPVPSTSRSVSLDVMGDANATVARLSFSKDPVGAWPLVSERDLVTGSSKRHPGDKPDAEVGELLAVADALEKLAGKLKRRARGRMRHLESIREHRRQIKAKADEPIPYTLTNLVSSLKDASGIFTGFLDKGLSFEFNLPKAEGYTEAASLLPRPSKLATRTYLDDGRLVCVERDGRVLTFEADGTFTGAWTA